MFLINNVAQKLNFNDKPDIVITMKNAININRKFSSTKQNYVITFRWYNNRNPKHDSSDENVGYKWSFKVIRQSGYSGTNNFREYQVPVHVCSLFNSAGFLQFAQDNRQFAYERHNSNFATVCFQIAGCRR